MKVNVRFAILCVVASLVLTACGGGGGSSSSANQPTGGGGTIPPPGTDPATVFPFPIDLQKLVTDRSATRPLWPKGDHYPAKYSINKVTVKVNSNYGDVYECGVYSSIPVVGGNSFYYLSAGNMTVDTSPQVVVRPWSPGNESVAGAERFSYSRNSPYGQVEFQFVRNDGNTQPQGADRLCYTFRLTISATELSGATLVLISQGG